MTGNPYHDLGQWLTRLGDPIDERWRFVKQAGTHWVFAHPEWGYYAVPIPCPCGCEVGR